MSRTPAASVATTVKLTNSGKVSVAEAEKITKQDLLDYYASVWPRMERFVVNRPLSLVRAPNGIDGQRFFQKHASAGMHEKIARIKDQRTTRICCSFEILMAFAALVQLGVVEIHIWGSKIDELEKPDQIVFDLDPDEGVSLEKVQGSCPGCSRQAR